MKSPFLQSSTLELFLSESLLLRSFRLDRFSFEQPQFRLMVLLVGAFHPPFFDPRVVGVNGHREHGLRTSVDIPVFGITGQHPQAFLQTLLFINKLLDFLRKHWRQ